MILESEVPFIFMLSPQFLHQNPFKKVYDKHIYKIVAHSVTLEVLRLSDMVSCDNQGSALWCVFCALPPNTQPCTMDRVGFARRHGLLFLIPCPQRMPEANLHKIAI